jgi:MscS family membrane protein
VPEALRDNFGIEAALQLKEIFDRMSLPPLDSIPDAQVVEAARQGDGLSLWHGNNPLRWRYPNTEIEIVEITDDDRQGQFLFSARTIRNLSEYYEEAAAFPYRLVQSGTIELQYRSPEISTGFYDYYITSPGDLVAGASLTGQLVAGLPDWLKSVYGGQTLWQWIGLVILIGVGFAAAVVILVVFKRTLLSRGLLGDWLSAVPPILVAVMVFFLGNFVDEEINITGTALAVFSATATLIILLMFAWSTYALFRAAGQTIITSRAVNPDTSDATLIRMGARVVGFLFAAAIVLWGIRHLGADLIPLLAGLGVGGLAVALAAQRTFANLIGSLILFINKPVRIGDFCRYGDQFGTVESIGLISTRIRSLERTIITVPNAEFSEIKLDNLTARDQRLLSIMLQLRYDSRANAVRAG